VPEGIEIVESARRRYDGEKRNPWDETECGPHYARAMSAWAALLALNGFRYQGHDKRLAVKPHMLTPVTQSFWSTGTGWGSFTISPTKFSLKVLFGKLPLDLVELPSRARSIHVAGSNVPFSSERGVAHISPTIDLAEGHEIVIQL
jgi:hypothetical protein